jgi:ATP-dependent exoDNAse (exonuclease V) beta subunit
VTDLRFTLGRKENWPDVNRVRDDCKALAARASGIVDEVIDGSLRALTRWIGDRVLAGAAVRRAEGKLEFHDLLVLSRDLLRRDAVVRASLHERYQRLLLDEFQDTDPIQIELAVRIAGGRAAAGPWQEIDVPPGRIFVVGDPKQSIYRFRRANIATYFDARAHLGHRVDLTTNFRTVPAVLGWVNAVFAKLIEPSEGQPAYQQLDRHREGLDGDPDIGPAVTVLGATAHGDLPRAQAETLRRREAADVAAITRRALDESWRVWDTRSDSWRPAEADDVAILVPARTSLPFLEDALDAAGVAYRAEASSLVYQAQEIRDLLACARAVADPSDALSLVTALRSPLFGCGDDELWRWKLAGGAFSIFSRHDPGSDAGRTSHQVEAVSGSLDYLRRLHNQVRWLTPSEVLSTIISDRRMTEVGATGPRARDTWRRLRFVVDQARAWSEVSSGGLRAYLAWAGHQGQEASRVAEAVLPETDAEAVKVMTIHAAKGLEFPIVILSGMTSEPQNQRGVQVLWPSRGGYEVKLSKAVQTGDFDVVQPLDEQMDKLERRRLLYVAATRARDHLVVSLHRAEGSNRQTNARLLFDAGAASAAGVHSFSAWEQAPEPVPRDGRMPARPAPDYATWHTRVQVGRDATRHVSAVSASGLEGSEPEAVLSFAASRPAEATLDPEQRAGKAKGARDLELPPWSKGRYGSAIGRAVHGVLQHIDLDSAEGLDAAVRAQTMAEGVVAYAGVVTGLVRSALESEVIRRAAARRHWREAYVGTVRGDTVHEGIIDLMFRDDDGSLVVVDYKTDAIPADALASRSAFYAPQIRSYVDMLTDVTGDKVHGHLLFLNPQGAAALVHVETPSGSASDSAYG